MEKYAAGYSASVDPFAAWRARAAEERRAGMGIHDRQGSDRIIQCLEARAEPTQLSGLPVFGACCRGAGRPPVAQSSSPA